MDNRGAKEPKSGVPAHKLIIFPVEVQLNAYTFRYMDLKNTEWIIDRVLEDFTKNLKEDILKKLEEFYGKTREEIRDATREAAKAGERDTTPRILSVDPSSNPGTQNDRSSTKD